jgi:hypothetical protein
VARRRRRRASDLWDEPDWIDPDELDDDLLDDVEFDLPDHARAHWSPPPVAERQPRKPSSHTGWKQSIDQVGAAMRAPGGLWPAGREIRYVISIPETTPDGTLALDVGCRQRKKNGEWRQLASLSLSPWEIERLPDPADRQILATLGGSHGHYGAFSFRSTYPGSSFIAYRLSPALVGSLLPVIVGTGRASLRVARQDDFIPVVWDDGPPWEFRLDISLDDLKTHYRVTGALCRGEERVDLGTPLLLLAAGFVFFRDRVARLDAGGAFQWISHLRQVGAIRVPVDQGSRFLGELLRMPAVPRHDLPAELVYESLRPVPRSRLRVERGPREWPPDLLRAELSFDYDGVVIQANLPERVVFQPEQRRVIQRDAASESTARERLTALGVRERAYAATHGLARGLALGARSLPRVARALLGEGWHVEADGKLYRQPGDFHLAVTTGIDWFELHGTVDFGDTAVPLPALLAALRRGESTVLLGDGTYGILPEAWLRKYAPVAGLGAAEADHVRFTRSQVGLLDALLAAEPEITCDALFARAREELRRFEGIAATDPPASFAGLLRGYQRDGLGWLHFLRQFGFGGCLADDMGLGKTVMVLALLESRRVEGRKKPSLVVVPRSLIFNWRAEAARFAPALTVLDHTGVARRPAGAHFADHDVVLTTYGTLRRDALHFKDVEFDYVVLDEAQAIKNASTDAAKAARLLRGDHRLALSGTPVENHLGELWSLLEFLNPGMLGAASALRLDGAGRNPDDATRALLARALRPFVLRRTKAQVAPELPPRIEQTVYCELEPLQRRLYDELRDHYRASLLGRIDRDGLGRSKIMILEALLRLRQAACHPGLVDRQRIGEPAGKLDVLLPRLREVLEEGHKALVFSQFTSFLAIVRQRLDREHIRYEYLDGATRDRAARVTHFQTDPGCRLFLVSLKAGGLGLNLTAAEHVFLLDPWWNPAVEAQAIDRAHRIGQTRHVLALRLIARDTVEEKILALQAEKRELADAIINEQNSLIRTLTREDLELLLS